MLTDLFCSFAILIKGGRLSLLPIWLLFGHSGSTVSRTYYSYCVTLYIYSIALNFLK